MVKLAANLSMLFTELDFFDRFRAAAACGFRGVEILFPYDRQASAIAEALRANGLEQVLLNLPPGDWQAGERGLAAIPGREAAFRDGLERALDYARALDCPQLHVMAGVPGDSVDATAARETFIANLRAAAKIAAGRAVRLLIEPINSRDMPGYFLTTVAQARAIIEAARSDNLFLQCDLYHAQIMSGDLARLIRANIDLVRHFQIAGVPDRHEPDHGEVNYRYLLDLIDSLDYDGWIGCEYRPAGDTRAGLSWAEGFGIRGEPRT